MPVALGLWDFVAQFSVQTALGALAAPYLILCTFIVAVRVTRWLLPGAGLPLHFSSVFAVGMWCATIGFHGLLALHAFRLPFALLGVSALAFAALRWLPDRRSARGLLRREWRAVSALLACARRSPHVAINTCFAGFALVLALRSLVIPPLGWDTLTYHGPRIALWIGSGQFTFDEGVGCYNFYRHFFSGGEILTAWAALPFHSDLLANLSSVFEWLGVFLASWALARALGLREPYAATSAGVVAFLPALQLEVNSGYVELALNAALFQGIALAVHALKRPSASAAVLCAMALGVAASIKLPALAPALLVVTVLSARLLAARRIGWRSKLRAAGIGAVCATLPALPFTIRAYLDTGYPLSPLPVRMFGLTLGVASPMLRWYQTRPDLGAYTWQAETQALRWVFSPLAQFNESFSSLGLLPLLVFPFGFAALLRRNPLTASLLLGAALVPVIAHFSPDFSAVRLGRAPSATRFLVPSMALLVPISLCWCSRAGLLSRVYRRCLLVYPVVMSLLAFKRGFGAWEAGELCALALLLTAAVTGLRWLQLRAAGASWLWGLGLGLIALCALQVRRDQTRELAAQSSYALHGFPYDWAAAVHWVDDAVAHRIAITGGPDPRSDKWFHYFFFGRRFQNSIQYIAPTHDGAVAQFGPGGELELRADMTSWLRRLRAAGIGEVLTFAPRSLEQTFMDAHPAQFERLQAGRDWGLYRVRGSKQEAKAQ